MLKIEIVTKAHFFHVEARFMNVFLNMLAFGKLLLKKWPSLRENDIFKKLWKTTIGLLSRPPQQEKIYYVAWNILDSSCDSYISCNGFSRIIVIVRPKYILVIILVLQ